MTELQRTADGKLICAGCFGPISGPAEMIRGLPYHPFVPGPGGRNGIRVCKPPPPLPRQPKPIPGQLSLLEERFTN